MPREHVLGDGQLRDEGAFLVDDGDAKAGGGVLIDAAEDTAIKADVALVGVVHPTDHLAQRRLAGAVLAQQGMDLAGADLDGDVPQGLDARELLPATAHLEAHGDAGPCGDVSGLLS